jgi:hypothetical protein
LPVKQVAPNLVGMRYADIRPTAIPGAILCGYVDPVSGQTVLATAVTKNTPTLTATTELLVLGFPKESQANTAPPLASSGSSTTRGATRSLASSGKRSSESILVCGWRPEMSDMLVELDATLAPGSKITVLDTDAPEEGTLGHKFKNFSLHVVRQRADQYTNLKTLLGPDQKASFDHVLVLSSALGSDLDPSLLSAGGVDEDSKALSSMVYINLLLDARKDGRNTSVTVYVASCRSLFPVDLSASVAFACSL